MKSKLSMIFLLSVIVLSLPAMSEVKRVGGFQNWIGMSSDTKPTSDEGSIFYETDTGRTYVYDGSDWNLKIAKSATDTTTMRAPGTSAAVVTDGYSRGIWYFKIASINTSVGVALQAKSGVGQWTNVWADSLVYTANGNYGLEWLNMAAADSIRFQWISESGGSSALITHHLKLSGGN